MSFLISEALAEGAPAAGAQAFDPGQLILMIGFVAIFYFILIRPQSKRAKEHKKMVAELAKGDEVVTSGGIYGKLTAIADDYIELSIAENTTIRLQRSAVGSVLPKGTIKNM